MDLLELSSKVEMISKLYAETHEITRDQAWFLLKLHEEMGELTQAFLMKTAQSRHKERSPQEIDEALGAELADVLCHVLLLARHNDVDIGQAVEHKWLVWDRADSSPVVPATQSRG